MFLITSSDTIVKQYKEWFQIILLNWWRVSSCISYSLQIDRVFRIDWYHPSRRRVWSSSRSCQKTEADLSEERWNDGVREEWSYRRHPRMPISVCQQTLELLNNRSCIGVWQDTQFRLVISLAPSGELWPGTLNVCPVCINNHSFRL